MGDFVKPGNFEEVILLLAARLRDFQYAFRGTASLVLQGMQMNVADIDIVGNEEAALACNDLLAKYLVEEVTFKESAKFKSYFGKFEVEGIPVEVMGEWQIKDTKGRWNEPFDASARKLISLNGDKVYVTSIEEELAVFAKMGRWTAYQKIKKQLPSIEKEAQPTLF